MENAIEVLEIELYKWKNVFRIHNAYMAEYPNDTSAYFIKEAERQIKDLNKAIEILKTYK